MKTMAREIFYWKQQLRDLSQLELPTDRPRSSARTFLGAVHPAELPAELIAPLRDLGGTEEATVFMVLLAAFQCLLHRYTGQDDIAVTIPTANGGSPDMKESAGSWSNILVLRADTSGDPVFRDLLRHVRRVTLDAFAHRYLPLYKLVEDLCPEIDIRCNPLLRVMFEVRELPFYARDMSGPAPAPPETGEAMTPFDLKVCLQETQEGFEGAFVYNTDLFDDSTIERMAGHYLRILEGIVSDPGQRLSELPLLTEAEEHQLLVEWNDTATDYPMGKRIHELIEEQVAKVPDNIAVVFQDRKITYRELNERANRLARGLRSKGVSSDVIVGIMVHRSIDMISGVLGVLKAGGAYLPIDPVYPDSRIEYMLKDSGVRILLTQENLTDRLAYDGHRIALDRDIFTTESSSNLDVEGSHRDLAYVIYTSGSTGTPKGVMVEHRSAVNLSAWFDREYDLAKNRNVIQSTTFSFDAAMEEILPTLISGACLFIPEKEETLDKHKFRAFVRKNRINIAQFVPVTLREFLADTDKIDSLNVVICGSEALDERLKDQILQKGYILYNNYGPTETTVDALSTRCTSNKVTVGKPICNTKCYILDRRLNPVPVGVAGELAIGGDGLMRGYLNRVDLTEEKFIPNPFSDKSGSRLFRTGDLARYLPDGNIEFLGRIDKQVKVRGHRIEPEEIETLLRHHPAVRQAVVVLREDQPGGKRLVAYVVPHGSSSISVSELRSLLNEKLPAYMVPSLFVKLDSLPVTPSGKVDRKSLPVPGPGRRCLENSFTAPRTATEKLIAGIWSEVLGLKEIGIDDNFFELGGHSLLATRVLSRMRNAFHAEIPFRSIFEMPTIEGLAKDIDEVLRAGQEQPGAILPMPRNGGMPLSFAQERLWFLSQLEPRSSAYNMHLTVRLTGEFDMPALERSLSEVLRRHEVLRTTFVIENNRPVQIVAAPGAVTVHFTDLSAAPEKKREASARQLMNKDVSLPFDLAAGPLMRPTLLRMSGHEYILLLTVHHIVSDGCSMDILHREILACYEAFSKGDEPFLADLPIQYADFAVWQKEWLRGKRLEDQISYWKEQLRDLPVLELPADYSRPSVRTDRGDRCSLQLSKEVSGSLNALSQRTGNTLFMIILATFNILLHRLSAQDDLVVGIPIAGRNRSETEGLIGFFVNTLVMRSDLSGNPTFLDVLSRVGKTALDAYAHQDLPFERLVEELRPQRDAGRTPLFQVMLNMLNMSDNSIVTPEMREEMIEADSKFDLTLYVLPLGDGIIMDLVYNADLFGMPRMIEMLEQMRHLLEQIVEAPEKPIHSYSLLTKSSELLLPHPDDMLPEPHYPPVTGMFFSHVERSPEHPAISRNGRTWTYEQLSGSVYHLAGVLKTLGIERGQVVAVSGPKSFGIVVAMVAVLSSGGVLLTIDQRLPDMRKRLMCREAKAKCLLNIGECDKDSGWSDGLFPVGIVTVEQDRGVAVDKNPVELKRAELPELSSDDPAYIFFTSGTTGVPKGVLGCHKGLSHFLMWQRDTFGVGPADRCAQLTGLSFDVVLRDVFLPLVSGATLCLPDETEGPASEGILTWLDRERITLLHTVPSVAQSWLVDVPQETTLESMRYVFFAGEPLRESLVRKWRDAFPEGGQIVNLYGPTETTLAKCFNILPAELVPGTQPVGRPIPHTQALVLAESGQLCGIGEVGEIVLRTPFRTLGYINNPDEQQRRFRRNHFRDDHNDLVYHTGDLGRYCPDGCLAILGRLDNQVKINGVRIEPDEIAALLERHPDVGSSVVTARENGHEGYILAAYVVGRRGAGLAVTEVRSYLKKHLPDYMMPSAIVMLDSLPLTPNGKVDRKALPAAETGQADHRDFFIEPRSPVEELVAGIWCGVLGLNRIDVRDNFFEVGGHSLLATQVMSRIRKEFQVEVPLRSLFERPTVEGLAESVNAALLTKEKEPALPIVPVVRTQDLPLSFAQERLWFLSRMEPDSAAYNMPLAVRLSGNLDVSALERSLAGIMKRHEVLRTTFVAGDDQPVQVITPPGGFTLPLSDISSVPEGLREEKVSQIVGEERRRPFDLEKGPLMRARLLRLTHREHILLLTVHHIVSDGWSMEIMYRELSALYEAFSRGDPNPLPELPVQYADFAVWQKEWLRGKRLEDQISYWKEQLRDLSMLQLPTDNLRPPVQTFQGAAHTVAFTGRLTRALGELSHKEGVTLFMVLLGAFQCLLHRYTGQDDIVVGSPIANRNHAETEGLIGFFVNTLVMRADTSGDPDFQELLKRVRKNTLDAYTHQDLPFEKLVEALQPERDLSRNPLVQVIFALQNVPHCNLALSDLALSKIEVGETRAKLDLEVYLQETQEGLEGAFVYNTDLFEDSTIERMAGHYLRILEGIVADPGQRLSELPLVTEAEEHQLLVEWNDTAADYSGEKCFHELFEEQVKRTPDAVALIFEEDQLTYAELNSRANRLAHHLKKLGVGRDVLVGLCMERSPEMVVGLIGIMKAGGAYVPLDPFYPSQRIAFMIEDSGAAVLVTSQHPLERLPSSGVQIVSMEEGLDDTAGECADNPVSAARPGDLAYVIYTSGSTGKPKGVAIPHGALVNFLCSMQKEPGLTDQDVFLSVTTPSFDIAAMELYLPLMLGARVVLAGRETAMDGALLADLLGRTGATVMQATPATWRLMMQSGWEGSRDLKILCGGEAMTAALADDLLSRGREVWNMYGPTETTIWSLIWKVEPHAQRMLIGRPIDNTQVYIVDRNMQPVPVGVAGELYIGGAGVAREYLNRPELTAEKFISGSFAALHLNGGLAAARIYNTGDLARWLPDGQIEFLGRIDHQVKIRGFRIEIGEIETVLGQHAEVMEAVVMAREDRPGDKRLVAYVVCPEQRRPAISELRSYVRRHLPDYMVPSALVMLDSLPLTPNGKVDRKALPVPDNASVAPAKAFVGPRNRRESQLTGIWEKVLGVQPVGIRDNFFEMGGHSLLAVKLASEIRKVTGQDVPVIAIFQFPTVEQLAERLAGVSRPARFLSLAALRPEGSRPPFFWVHGQQSDPLLAKFLGEDQPLYALLHQGTDGKIPYTTLEEIAGHYLEEIRTVRPKGPYMLGGYCFGAIISLEIARLLLKEGEEVPMLFLLGPPRKFFPPAARPLVSLEENAASDARFVVHYRNLAALPAEGKVAYAIRMLPRAFTYVMRRLKKKAGAGAKMVGSKVCHRLGIPFPHSLAVFYLLAVYDKAIRNYSPSLYPGRLAICLPDKYSFGQRSDLDNIAFGGVDLFDVPGAEHEDLILEPQVKVWAPYLKTCLDRVHAESEAEKEAREGRRV